MRTKVILLGTGTPNAEPDRSGPSTAVLVDGRSYLVDCGPGVVRSAAKACDMGFKSLSPGRLNTLYITHLHSDHTLGLPDLIFTPWVLGRKVPLKIFGPPGTAGMVKNLLKAWKEDIRVRTEGLERANRTGYRVKVTEIGEGHVYEDDLVKVSSFKVEHGDWDHALGYRFECPDRTVVISGDCRPSGANVKNYIGCDVLVHEAYCQRTFDGRPDGWKAYHKSAHTSTIELGKIAREVRPNVLVLTHQLPWGATPDEMIEEVRSVYDGNVRFGMDLDVI